MKIDLQLHSTYSDGKLTPTAVAKLASSNEVKVAALTDHNTVGGIDEFKRACKKRKIKPLVGLELYVKLDHKRFNLLWYNFDDASPTLHSLLRETQIRRRGNVRKILSKLAEEKAIELDIEKILDSHNHYIPINGIIYQMMRSKKNQKIFEKDINIKNPREEHIMKEYLKNKQYGVLRESYVDIRRVVRLRKKLGGQLIINHPGKSAHLNLDQFATLKKMGIDGLEVLSPHHSWGAVVYYQYIAKKFDFISTGGSDFHLYEKGQCKIKNPWNYFEIDSKYLRKIREIIG